VSIVPHEPRCYNSAVSNFFIPEEVPVYRFPLVLPALFLLTLPVLTQQSPSSTPAQKPGSYAAIPVEAAKAQNPVKPSPESTARAKKW
jgi:hypothetical protein